MSTSQHRSPILRDIIHAFPFSFAQKEMYLLQEEYLHSQVMDVLLEGKSVHLDTKHRCQAIIELTVATIRLHNSLIERHSQAKLSKTSHLNKQLVLAGDYYFSSALSLIPQLHHPSTEMLIYEGIQKSCLGHVFSYLGLHMKAVGTLRAYKHLIQERKRFLLTVACVMPFSLMGFCRRRLREVTKIAKIYSYYVQLCEDLYLLRVNENDLTYWTAWHVDWQRRWPVSFRHMVAGKSVTLSRGQRSLLQHNLKALQQRVKEDYLARSMLLKKKRPHRVDFGSLLEILPKKYQAFV